MIRTARAIAIGTMVLYAQQPTQAIKSRAAKH